MQPCGWESRENKGFSETTYLITVVSNRWVTSCSWTTSERVLQFKLHRFGYLRLGEWTTVINSCTRQGGVTRVVRPIPPHRVESSSRPFKQNNDGTCWLRYAPQCQVCPQHSINQGFPPFLQPQSPSDLQVNCTFRRRRRRRRWRRRRSAAHSRHPPPSNSLPSASPRLP